MVRLPTLETDGAQEALVLTRVGNVWLVDDPLTRATADEGFNAEADGRTWNVRCNLNSGEMIAREAGTGGSFVGSTAGFIKKLHMARGYPVVGKLSIRWWWAVIVDGMASLMLLWGLSGLAMWWQMKGQRKWGAVTLFACAFVTWLVWTGMQHALR